METGKRVQVTIGLMVSIVLLCVGILSAQNVWAADASVNLAWDKNAEPDVQYYRLYTGATPQEVIDKTNPAEDLVGPAVPADLPDRITAPKTIEVADDFEGIIYYGIAAVDTSGNESAIDPEEVVSKVFDFLAPSPVTGVSAE